MKIIVRRGAAVLATAIALSVPALATTLPTAQAADGAFTTVATLPGAASVASPADGQAYVAGTDATGAAYVRLYTGAQAADVALPGVSAPAKPRLSSTGGRTYVLVDDGGAAKLFQLEGTTATPIALPAGYTAWYRLAADETGVWVDTTNPVTVNGMSDDILVDFHWDGSAWTSTSTTTGPSAHFGVGAPGSFGNPPMYAKDGVLYDSTSYSATMTSALRPYRWTAGSWGDPIVPVPGGSYTDPNGTSITEAWTLVSGTDYTSWGHQGWLTGSKPAVGQCTHVVDVTPTACPAPQWPVTAAARLADGRVVLGGAPAGGGSTLTGGFAVVDVPGAQPAAFPGDAQSRVDQLAAPPAGTTVWAVTRTATGATLQSATLPATPAPTPTPTTPTPEPTTTVPTPEPTTTTPCPSPTKTHGPKPKPTSTKTPKK